MKLKSAVVFLAFTVAVSADEVPRKTKGPRESYPDVDVIYDSVTMPDVEFSNSNAQCQKNDQ